MSLVSRCLTSRSFGVGALALGILGVVAFGIVGVGRPGRFTQAEPDTGYFYVAGQCLKHRVSPYDPASFAANRQGFRELVDNGYFYPPQFGTLCVILASLPFVAAKVLMVCLNSASVCFLAWLCARSQTRDSDLGVSGDAPEARWLIPAVILGNPFTSHVFWLGQTSLLAAAALAGSWYFATRGRTGLGGVLIGLATIKPQLALPLILWFLLEIRWKVLLVGAATALLMSVPQMGVSGPVGAFTGWLQALAHYDAVAANTIGFQHIFSVQAFLAALGLRLPGLFPAAVAGTILLWAWRRRVQSADVLPVLIVGSLLFGYSHDYDLAALVILLPAFWRHLRGREKEAILAGLLMLVLFVPQRSFQRFKSDLLLQFRVPLVMILVSWLLFLSIRGAAARSPAVPTAPPRPETEKGPPA